MKFDEFRDTVLNALRTSPTPVMTGTELARLLGLRGKERKSIQKWLVRLSRDGDIVYFKPNRFSLPPKDEIIEGILTVLRSGNGILVNPETQEEIFIPEEEVGRALPGDRVLVRVLSQVQAPPGRSPDSSRHRNGTISRIIERASRDIVGTVRIVGHSIFVAPIDPAFRRAFHVAEGKGARANDRVVIRMTGWDSRSDSPDGEIVEVLGSSADPSVDTIAIIRHYGFRIDFPEDVLRESEAAVARADAIDDRMDLRDRFIFTIDPSTARDFDDAVSIQVTPEGNRILGVHIADVAHYVRRGSAMDTEARARGNSVYLADKVIPMLPERLSNGICSLRPDEDRLTVSVFLTIDPCGRVLRHEFARTLIRSKLRLTYEQAMALINGRTGVLPVGKYDDPALSEIQTAIQQIHEVSKELRAIRFADHALDMDIPESEVSFNEDGSVSNIRLVKNDPSHQLIEECMVAANEAVALELAKRGMPLISRLHEAPDEEKIDVLRATLSGMGFAPGNLHHQSNMAAFLRKVKDEPLGFYVQTAVLRSLKRALYSGTAHGHYGLAKSHYAHFTAPIRRYTDIVLHRQLIDIIEGRGQKRLNSANNEYTQEVLSSIARECSTTEKTADEAERALSDILKYRFLQQQIDTGRRQSYSAVVVEVARFGLFIEVLELHLRGLVHSSSLSERHGVHHARHDRKKRSLSAGRTTYGPGQVLSVMVSRVDIERRQVDFVTCDKRESHSRSTFEA